MLPRTSGRCSSPATTRASSPGTPTSPTSSGWPATSAPGPPAGTGAVREGCALCQGLATCGTCGRKLAVYYDGPAKSTPGYYCASGDIVNGRGVRHLRAGGTAIDAAVADAFLAALQPAALQACLAAASSWKTGHDAVLDQHRRQVEQARYQASGRTPLPRGRPGEPAGRPRPGNRVEHRAGRAWPAPKPNSPAARPRRPAALTDAERAADHGPRR